MHPQSVDSLSGLSVDSPVFRQRAPRVQLSDDPDTATRETVQEMCRQIHQAANDPLVQQVAKRAVLMFSGGPHSFGVPDAVWAWSKHNLRFKHHGAMFEAWSSDLGDPRTKLQLLIAPDVLIRMSRMEGDCAIYTMMVCSMLEALGIQWEIVTAAVDARQPKIFGHVWPRAILPDGARESLDASHGKYPGWQVPAYDLHRVWIFNANGQRIGGEQRGGFTGLHDYRRARGMGDLENPWGDTTPPVDTYPSSYVNPTEVYGNFSDYPFIDSTGSPYSGPTYTAPSQSSSQWAAFAAAMGKAGFDLAKLNAIQPGTVLSANGAILRQNPGYAVGTPTGTLNLGGISTTTLMVGGLLLIGAVFMFSRSR